MVITILHSQNLYFIQDSYKCKRLQVSDWIVIKLDSYVLLDWDKSFWNARQLIVAQVAAWKQWSEQKLARCPRELLVKGRRSTGPYKGSKVRGTASQVQGTSE